MADVALGFLLTHDPAAGLPWGVFALLVGASACLYEAGMALNDVFDVEIDRQERPDRPIPSGRVLSGCTCWALNSWWWAPWAGRPVTSKASSASGLALTVLPHVKARVVVGNEQPLVMVDFRIARLRSAPYGPFRVHRHNVSHGRFGRRVEIVALHEGNR